MLENCSNKYSRIIDQCLGASTSIGANISEGNSSPSQKVKKRYFEIALNSSYEFDNWLQILKDSDTICANKNSLNEIESHNLEVVKMLSKMISTHSS